jgi:hypothetical protein
VKKYQPAPEAVTSPRHRFREGGQARFGCLRMPAGERVTARLRSRSSGRASVVEANVITDGVSGLDRSLAGHDTVTETV